MTIFKSKLGVKTYSDKKIRANKATGVILIITGVFVLIWEEPIIVQLDTLNFFVIVRRYVDDLFKLDSSMGSGNLKQFEEVINQETFWVATEILKEPNALKRMKTIKHFIKIALHCRECKNFNSMFAIIRWVQCRICLKSFCVYCLPELSLVTGDSPVRTGAIYYFFLIKWALAIRSSFPHHQENLPRPPSPRPAHWIGLDSP